MPISWMEKETIKRLRGMDLNVGMFLPGSQDVYDDDADDDEDYDD